MRRFAVGGWRLAVAVAVAVSVPGLARAAEDCNAKNVIFAVCADQGKILDEALAKAKADGKPLLAVFGANWCPWCQSLHRILRESELPEAGDYAVVHVGLYNGQAEIPSGVAALGRVLKMAGVKQRPGAIPIVAVVNPAGEKAELVKTSALERNTKVSKGYDPEKLFPALAGARRRLMR